jgi:hypothetical protein
MATIMAASQSNSQATNRPSGGNQAGGAAPVQAAPAPGTGLVLDKTA